MPSDDEISIRASLDNDVSGPALAAAHSIDDLSDEVEELSARLAFAQAQLKGTRNELRDTQVEARRTAHEVDKLNTESAETEAQIAKLEAKLGQLNRTTGLTIGKILQLRTALFALKLPLLAAGATAAATAVNGLGFGLLGLVGALGPATGALGVLPGLLGALVGVIGVLTAGFSGIGDAASVLADPAASAEQIEEALRHLSPVAQAFAADLARALPVMRHLREHAQNGLLPGAREALASLLTLVPVLESRLTGLADVVGRGMAGAAAELASRGGDLGLILDSTTRVLERLEDAARPVVGIFVDIMAAAGPVTEMFADDLAFGLDRAADAIARMRAGGELGAFFENGYTAVRRIVGVLVDLSAGLVNILRIGGDAGRELGLGIENAARAFRAFTESPEGVAVITGHFERAVPVVEALGRLLLALGGAFLRIGSDESLAPLIDRITVELVPALESAISSFGTGLLPALLDTAVAAAAVVQVLALSPLVPAVRSVAEAVRAVAEAFSGLPVPVQQAVLGIVGVAAAAAKYGAAKQAVLDVADSFKKLGGDVKRVWQWVKPILTPALTAVRVALVAAATAARGFAAALLTNPIFLAVAAVVALGVAIWQLYQRSETFRGAVQAVWEWLQRMGSAAVAVGGQVLSAIGGAFQAVWGVVSGVLSAVGGAAMTVFSGIWSAVQTVGRVFTVTFGVLLGVGVGAFMLLQAAWSVVYPYLKAGFLIVQAVALTVWNAITTAAGAAWAVLQVGFSFVRGAFIAVWTAISAVAAQVWAVVSAGAQLMGGALRGVFTALRGVAIAVFAAVRGVGLPVWNVIRAAASTAFGGIRTLFDGVRIAATTVFGGIRSFVSGVWSAIRASGRVAMNGVIDNVNGVIRGFNTAITLANRLPGIDIGLIGEIRPRAAGGPVWPGAPFLVGEQGPELARIGSRLELLGQRGPELRTFAASGEVLSAPVTERVFAEAAVAAPVRGSDGAVLEDLVAAIREQGLAGAAAPIHVHAEGMTREEAERMVVRAIRRERTERAERR